MENLTTAIPAAKMLKVDLPKRFGGVFLMEKNEKGEKVL